MSAPFNRLVFVQVNKRRGYKLRFVLVQRHKGALIVNENIVRLLPRERMPEGRLVLE